MNCKACGDPITDYARRASDFRKMGIQPSQSERSYCLECANELFRGWISNQPARLYSGGRDRKREPDPSQKNAVRALEDRSE
jgi:hypothetical protein